MRLHIGQSTYTSAPNTLPTTKIKDVQSVNFYAKPDDWMLLTKSGGTFYFHTQESPPFTIKYDVIKYHYEINFTNSHGINTFVELSADLLTTMDVPQFQVFVLEELGYHYCPKATQQGIIEFFTKEIMKGK